MASISTHLHRRPYQVAVTNDPRQLFRKWDHLGTYYAPTHRSAAAAAYKGGGSLTDLDCEAKQRTEIHATAKCRALFRSSCGLFISVGF